MSDGADTSDVALGDALLGLKAEKLPVFTVGVGSPQLTRDIQIDRVSTPKTVLKDASLMVNVVITQTGYSGRTVTVDVEDEGRIVGSQQVQLPADGSPATARVRATVTDAGPRLFKFRVAQQPDEVVPQNNVRESLIEVRDRKEKILYFEGEPRFEMKFIRRAIVDDKNLQVVALQRTADNKFLRLEVDDQDELLGGFPKTREELFSYRALILGSIEAAAFTGRPAPDDCGLRGPARRHAAHARRRALVRRGRLWRDAGGRCAAARDRPKTRASEPAGLFRLQVPPTRAGQAHAATQIAGTEAASPARWRDLPLVTAVNAPLQPKPGATVLLNGTDERGRTQPVLTWHQFGRGKAIAMTLQDTWQWQMHASISLEDQTHENYWRQLMRWLVDGVPGVVEARTTMDRVEPGEAVTIEAAVVDPTFVELNDATVIAHVARPGGGTLNVPLSWTGERDGQYRGTFVRTEAGSYEVTVDAARAGKQIGVGSHLPAGRPERRRVLRPDDARAAAAAHRGGNRRPLLHAGHRRGHGRRRSLRRPGRHLGRRARALEHANRPPRVDGPGLCRVGLSARGGAVLMLKAFLLIVVGLAGDPEHGKLFHKWGASLAEASAKVGVTPDRVVYLVDQKDEEDKLATGRSTREEIQKAIDGFAKAAAAEDVVYVILIGHGSFDGQSARFNLPGPDMNAGGLQCAAEAAADPADRVREHGELERPVRRDAVGAGADDHHGHAQRRGAVRDAVRRLLRGGVHLRRRGPDKNQRVSMLEAFRFAKAERRPRLRAGGSARHRARDARRQRRPRRQPGPVADRRRRQAGGVDVAGIGGRRRAAAGDPKLRALYLERRDLERRVESLRLLKDSMPPARYTAELEKLVTDLALKTREIRTHRRAARSR